MMIVFLTFSVSSSLIDSTSSSTVFSFNVEILYVNFSVIDSKLSFKLYVYVTTNLYSVFDNKNPDKLLS